MENNLDENDAGSAQQEPQLRIGAQNRVGAQGRTNGHKLNVRGKGVVSVLSVAASALAVICFVTGRTTLSDFVSPAHSAASPPVVSAASTRTQTEQLFSRAAFFVHYGHLPGRGTDDYDADDTEDDRQSLIAGLESYIASAPGGLPGKAGAAGRKSLARAQSLRQALTEMKPGNPFKLPKLPQLP